MSKKHRSFRKKYNGISPYQMWILVGLGMANRIICSQKKRMYLMTDKTGVPIFNIHAESVNQLLTLSLIHMNNAKTCFNLTPKGFDLMMKRMSLCGAKPMNGIDNTKQQIQYTIEEFEKLDSSIYCG